jgi:hypothetical protein
MITPQHQFDEHNWRDLYLQAIFETDRTKMVSHIRQAETALLRREQELYVHGDLVERESVNAALHALDALKRCFEIEIPKVAA